MRYSRVDNADVIDRRDEVPIRPPPPGGGDVGWDDGRVETVALVIGKDCQDKIGQIVTMAREKMALPGCAMARVSRLDEGWRVAGRRRLPG